MVDRTTLPAGVEFDVTVCVVVEDEHRGEVVRKDIQVFLVVDRDSLVTVLVLVFSTWVLVLNFGLPLVG